MPLNLMFHTALLTIFIWPLSTLVSAAKNPFKTIQARSNDANLGCDIWMEKDGHPGLGFCDSGNYLGFKNYDFNKPTIAFQMLTYFNVPSPIADRRIYLRLDSATAPPFLTFDQFLSTNDLVTITQLIPTPQQPQGVHDFYITFHLINGTGMVAEIYWIKFISSDDYIGKCTTSTPSPPTTVNASTPLAPSNLAKSFIFTILNYNNNP